jgi:Fe-S cluster biogenesis protein NfuA/nitrite reductase/ring-hydroxylating ferredoxin subunit
MTAGQFERHVQRAEALVRDLEGLPEEARQVASEAVQELLAMHGEALQRFCDLIEARAGRRLLEELAEDRAVGGLLVLHGLHPRSLEARVQGALERVRPYLQSHGGGVELMGLVGGRVRIRLEGHCRGCPSSTQTLRNAVEQAILEAAPDVGGIEVADQESPAGFVPLASIGGARAGWQTLADVVDQEPGTARVLEVAGIPLLLCRTTEALYAYRDRCAACGGSFQGAALAGTALTCPACGHRFDVRQAGASVDGNCRLEPVPLLVEQGRCRVAVPVGA